MGTVFEAVGGESGLRRLAEAWHSRVMADDVVAHAFSRGFHPDHLERLAAYWSEALGGPPLYTDRYGDETAVVRIHSGNGPHEEMDRRAIACFDDALRSVGLSDDDALTSCCTTTSPGRPRPRWADTTTPPTTYPTTCGSRGGRGRGWSRARSESTDVGSRS